MINHHNPHIQSLLESPLYAMSLSSIELFHSNMWHWLMKTDQRFASVFFNQLTHEDVKEVTRESRNRDIVIELNDGSNYVIENKIKSIPGYKQLEDYETNTKPFKKGVLTGLKETLDLSAFKLWSFLSYREIAEGIMRTMNISSSPIIKKHQAIIHQYCQMITTITELIEQQLEKSDNILDYNTGDLHEIRFDDVYRKLKAEDFLAKRLRNSRELDALVPEGFEKDMHTAYTNKSAYIDFRFKNKNDIEFGVQIQGYRFGVFAEKRTGNKTEEVFKAFSEYGWFDTNFSYPDHRTIFNHTSYMRPPKGRQYNKYSTSRYSHVYQHFYLDAHERTYDAVYDLIIKYMRKASKEIAPKIKL